MARSVAADISRAICLLGLLTLFSTQLSGCARGRLETEGPLSIATSQPTHSDARQPSVKQLSADIAKIRAQALDDLRAQPAFSRPVDLSICPDAVSWLPPTPKVDGDIWWKSRQRNLEIKARCRKGEIEKAKIIRDQRRALDQAR